MTITQFVRDRNVKTKEKPKAFFDLLSQFAEFEASRSDLSADQCLSEIFEDLMGRTDYPPDLVKWLQDSASKSVANCKKRNRRKASREVSHEKIDTFRTRKMTIEEPWHEAIRNEQIEELHNLAQDDFERNVLESLMKPHDEMSDASQQGTPKYSRGHASRRSRAFQNRLIEFLQS